MAPPRPPRRILRNHHLDSTRWDGFVRRPGDIIVATPYKCGTTWMQTILLALVFQDTAPRSLHDHSAWLDFRPANPDARRALFDAQTHRRVIKSHLPADAIPIDPACSYIIVGRDPRDVFMSLWDHYSAYTEAAFAEFNDAACPSAPLPPCPDTPRALWAEWISRGWFEGEVEGWPFWSNFGHVQSWWELRDQPNLLFVHYNDLLTDLPGEVARVARFADLPCDAALCDAIAEATQFSRMKENAGHLVGAVEDVFEGGAKRFVNKGTNGRWRAVLTAPDLAAYDATARATLGPDCRAWLEGYAAPQYG
ncbi:MAG: sulfotransferase domain-containing protein [Pseudomonadota bacterium]